LHQRKESTIVLELVAADEAAVFAALKDFGISVPVLDRLQRRVTREHIEIDGRDD
jgi:hypothetical protein